LTEKTTLNNKHTIEYIKYLIDINDFMSFLNLFSTWGEGEVEGLQIVLEHVLWRMMQCCVVSNAVSVPCRWWKERLRTLFLNRRQAK
jgi:hypothetical protein